MPFIELRGGCFDGRRIEVWEYPPVFEIARQRHSMSFAESDLLESTVDNMLRYHRTIRNSSGARVYELEQPKPPVSTENANLDLHTLVAVNIFKNDGHNPYDFFKLPIETQQEKRAEVKSALFFVLYSGHFSQEHIDDWIVALFMDTFKKCTEDVRQLFVLKHREESKPE